MATFQQQDFGGFNPKRLNIIYIIAGVVILLIFLSKASVTINAGESGVLFRTFGNGVETDRTYGEGFHIIAPWNKMIKYEVRQQEKIR